MHGLGLGDSGHAPILAVPFLVGGISWQKLAPSRDVIERRRVCVQKVWEWRREA